jgi:hypothetical protein
LLFKSNLFRYSAVGVSVELDGAYASVISEKQVLLTTKAGALMLLSLRIEGRRLAAAGAMHLRRAGGAVGLDKSNPVDTIACKAPGFSP